MVSSTIGVAALAGTRERGAVFPFAVRRLARSISVPGGTAWVESMGSLFGGLAEWVADVIVAFGYPGIALLIAIENLFPPIPSELILPFAGFLTWQGRLSYPLAVIAATAGSVVGALILYAVGAALGERRLRALIRRFGRWALLEEKDLDGANSWFDRHGTAAVLICRLVPLVRSVVSLPAGVRRMPIGRFVGLTAIGSSLWNGTLVGLGWLLGTRWEQVEQYVEWFQWVVILILAAAVARFVWHRWSGRHQPARHERDPA